MNPCRATVKESGGSFTISQISHKHDPETGIAVACKVVKKIKEIVVTDVFKPASAIVENVLLRLRPEEPRDLALELKEDCLPDGFIRGDVCVKDRRHLIFGDKRTTEVIGENKALVCIIIALRLNNDE